MTLDAKTGAYFYALIRDEWRELEAEAERAEISLDYDRQEEIANRLTVVRGNMWKIKAELSKYEIKEVSGMKHRYGDVIKVLANTEISHGETLTNGKTYDIRRATEYGVHIVDDRGESFFVSKSQLHYTEIVKEETE